MKRRIPTSIVATSLVIALILPTVTYATNPATARKRPPPPTAITPYIKDIIIYAHLTAVMAKKMTATQLTAKETEKRAEVEEARKEFLAKQLAEQCSYGDRACRVEVELQSIEQMVSDIADKYRDKSIWDRPTYDKSEGAKGPKIFRYVLDIPSYTVRFFTWPVALGMDYLIKKGVVRKVVNVISSKDRRIWVYPKIEMGFGSGFGGGVGYRHYDLFHKGYDFNASYQIHINLNQEAGAKIKKDDLIYLAGKPFGFFYGIQYMRHHDITYYGIGIRAPNSNKALYNVDSLDTGGWLQYQFYKNFYLRGGVGYLWTDAWPDTGKGTPSVTTTFPQPNPAGLGRTLQYARMGLDIVHDNRDSTITPQKGGRRFIRFERYQGLNTTQYDFNKYTAEASQFIKALMPRHVLALHGMLSYEQMAGRFGIPFQLLQRIDVYSLMRGFDYGRYSDRGIIVFNAEYRYPVWRFLEGRFFFDTGRVFHSPCDFSFKHFRYDGGIGLRVHTENYFLLRADVGYGGQGVKFYVKTTQAF